MSEVLSPFNLAPEKIDSLRRTIEGNQGEATMVIHPFFGLNQPNIQYEDRLARVIQKELLREGVLFLLEPHRNPELIEASSGLRGTILEVKTTAGGPAPIFDREVMDPALKDFDARYAHFWGRITDLGVRKFNLAGRLLNYADVTHDTDKGIVYKKWASLLEKSQNQPSSQEWLRKGLLPFACVGSIAKECVERGIDTEITRGAAPQQVYPLTKFMENQLISRGLA